MPVSKRWGEGLVWVLIIDFEGREPMVSVHFSEEGALQYARNALKERIESMEFSDFEWGEEEAQDWISLADKNIQEAWKQWYEFTTTEGSPQGFSLAEMEVQP
jgi:hypothetical protein